MMKKVRQVLWAFILFFCLFSLSGVVYADETNSKDELRIESITVTADKRKENIQEIPSTISAFTEKNMEDADIDDIADVVDFIPNMVFNSSFMNGSNETNFRGLNTSMFTNKNPVVIFIDGVPQDAYSNYGVDLFDVERIEVLRGPQGTLYGKNAIGGVINIISKKPGNEVQGKITGEIAEHGIYKLSAYVNGPVIKDKLFFGLSGTYDEKDGFMDNDSPRGGEFDDEKGFSISPHLRWLPTDRSELNIHLSVSKREDGSGVQNAYNNGDVKYHAYKGRDDYSEPENFNGSIHYMFKGDSFDLTSITTMGQNKMDVSMDQGYLGPRAQFIRYGETTTDSFSQEIRFSSPESKEGIKWVGGFYGSSETQTNDEFGHVYYSDMMPFDIRYEYPGKLKEETMAAFGQTTIPLPGRLEFTAGLRYERIDKTMDFKYNVKNHSTGDLFPQDPFMPGSPTHIDYSIFDDWNKLLPKAALSWKATDDMMFYSSVTKGYLAGGFNITEFSKDKATFNEQNTTSYELGMKSSWLDNKVIFNANLFYMDIEDMHVFIVEGSNAFTASNAGEAHSKGIEIELKAKPVRGLDLMASAGIIDAEYDDYTNTGGEDCSGKTIERTPEYTFNFAAQYRHSTGFYARGEVQGFGKTYFDEKNTSEQDAYQLYNMKIGYEAESWDIYLYGDNLFDEEYFSSGHVTGGGIVTNIGDPQTFGVKASLRF